MPQSEAPLQGGPQVTNPVTGARVAAPPPSWPTAGCVSFDNVVMQYKAGGERVLNGVSFKTRFFERVGIVGRTGAGKVCARRAAWMRTTRPCRAGLTLVVVALPVCL